MNGMMIGIGVLVVLFTLDGYRKGLIRKLVGIAAWVITLSLVSVTVPYIAGFLKENTGLYALLQERISGGDGELLEMLRIIGLEEMAVEFVADKILQLAAFVVTFLLVSVVVHGAAWALHIAASLPLLHGINQILGAAAGFLESVLLIWIAFLVIGAFSTSSWGGKALSMIMGSDFLTWMFIHNPLLRMFLG